MTLIPPKITTAMEIAVLVKCLPDIQQAADLIEQYAQTVAAGAKVEATMEAYDRVLGKRERGDVRCVSR